MVAQVMAEFLRNQKKCLNSNDLDVSIGNFNKLPLLNIEMPYYFVDAVMPMMHFLY